MIDVRLFSLQPIFINLYVMQNLCGPRNAEIGMTFVKR